MNSVTATPVPSNVRLMAIFFAMWLTIFVFSARAQPYAASEVFNLTLDQLPYSGILTLDEFDWFSTTSRLGIIQIDLATGAKRRLYQGKYPWRHGSGDVVYTQACGQNIHRIMRVDASGLPIQITPCSSEIDNPGASNTDFEFSRLSVDGNLIAVEAKAYIDWGYRYRTLVFDRQQTLVASFDDLYAPEWLPDGRLLLAGEGIFITDPELSTLTRLDGGRLVGMVNNISVDPTGTRLVFEFNQQIWHMKLDGSELRELIYGSAWLKYPTWSPDSSTIVYLATPQQDYYFSALFFTDLTSGQSYAVDLSPVLAQSTASNTVNGPLSWR